MLVAILALGGVGYFVSRPSQTTPNASIAVPECPFNADQLTTLIGLPMISSGKCQFVSANNTVVDPAGNNPAGKNPSGNNPAGKNPSGNPAGKNPAGNNPAGNNPAGNNPAGNNPAGNNPAGNNPAGKNAGRLVVELQSASRGREIIATARNKALTGYPLVEPPEADATWLLGYDDNSAIGVAITPKGSFTISMIGFSQFNGGNYRESLASIIRVLPQ